MNRSGGGGREGRGEERAQRSCTERSDWREGGREERRGEEREGKVARR